MDLADVVFSDANSKAGGKLVLSLLLGVVQSTNQCSLCSSSSARTVSIQELPTILKLTVHVTVGREGMLSSLSGAVQPTCQF